MMNDYNSLSSGIFASLKRTIQKKATWLLFFVLFSFISVQGQVTVAGAVTGNGTYTTLSAAFAAIPVAQVGANITVTITGDTSEPATGATLVAGTWTSLTIAPDGGSWTVSGAATAGTPLINFLGSDNVTVNGGGNLTFANTTVASTTGTSTLKLVGDATYNTFNNLTILGSANGATGSNTANVWISTGATSGTGNDFNSFQSCKFGPAGTNLPGQLIVANGSTTNTTIQNSNITINNCEFSDYFQAATASAAIYMSTGNTAWTVTNNKIFQTAARLITTSQTDYGIYMVNAGATALGESFVITGNTIGYASNSGTGTMTYAAAATSGGFVGINFSASAASTSTNSITNNIISDIQWTSTAGSIFTGIASSGLANVTAGAVYNVTGNTVRNIASVTATGTMIGIYAGYAPTTSISNNTVNNITRTGSGTMYGIQYNGGATTTTTLNANTVSNLANNNASSASALYAIYSGSNTANEIWTNNTIEGLSSLSTGGVTIYGIYNLTSTAGNKTCQNNTIRNFSLSASSTGTMMGIRLGYLGAANIISGNTIYNFSGATTIHGLYVGGSSAALASVENVFNNKIYGLSSSAAAAGVYGITIAGGITNNVYNNIIGNLSSPAANSTISLVGIFLSGGTTANVYYNTVNISGTSSGVNFGSAAVFASATPTSIDLRNNIFVNNSSANGTGRAVAFQRSAAALTNYAATSNNNLFYGTTATYFDGTTAYAFGAFQALVTPIENASKFQNLAFASTTGADASFLHFADGAINLAGGFATTIAGYTTDFDGNTRDASTPDMGAHEWNNGVIIAPTITGYSTTYSPFAPFYLCSNGGSVVTITGTSLDVVTSVLFNGSAGVTLPGTITAQSATSITVTAPADVVDGVIRVVNPGGFADSVATFTTALPPTIGVSSAATICSGTSTSLVATGANTYTWTPSLGLNGTTLDTVNASPTTSTTYTVTGITTAGCKANNTVSVTVNSTPSAITIAKNPALVCLGGVSTLTATGGLVGGTMQGVIGTGTTTSTSSGSYSAFNGYRASAWSQTIFTAAELTAAGLTAGNIGSIAYNINSQGSSTTNNVTIKIGTTATSAFANTSFYATTGFTTVFGPTSYAHSAAGWQTINFATPYVWNGTSNIVVDVWQDGPDASADPLTYLTAALDNKANFAYNIAPSAGAVGTLTPNRFNVTFTGTNSTPTTLAWTPTTDLYSNVGATTAYAGENIATVYTNSLTPQTYTVTATLGACSSTANVTVTPTALPTIAATGTTNCGTAGSAITATGGVSYVWSPALGLNGTSGESVIASPAATTTYTVTGTDANGCVNTTTALVTVNNPVTIAAAGQPANAVVLVGEATSFTVTANGTGLAYQWQINDSTGWMDIAGANAATYSLSTTTLDQNNYQFRCVVSGTAPCTPVTSNAANLGVGTVSIVSQPAAQTICSNNTATFSVVAGGDILSYQWQYSTNGTVWTDLLSADATTASITLSGLTAANSLAQYHCVLNAGQITSNPALLTVSDAIVIGTQPTSQSVCSTATSVTFTAAATGTGLAYQWQMSTNGASWTNVTGATATTFTIANPTIALNGNQYKVIVTGVSPCSTVTSDVATLTVTGVTVSTSASTICVGASITLSAVYTGAPGTTTSSWACALNGSGATTAVSGDSATVTPTAAGTYVYTFTTNGSCSFAPTVSVTVNPLPLISAVTATPAALCSDATINLAAASIANANGTAALGAGALTSGGTAASLLPGAWGGAKTQYLVKASELTALGFAAGNITSVAFEPTTSGQTYQGFFLSVGSTTASALTSTFLANGTQVYAGTLTDNGFTPAANTLNTLSFGTGTGSASSFAWDGTSNLVLTFSWSRLPLAATATGSTMKYDTASYTCTTYKQADNQSAAAMLAQTAGTTSSSRPKFTFGGVLATNFASGYVWSWNSTPAVTTALGTTSITNTSSAIVTQAFTATATIAATGCTNSATTSLVTINSTIPAPTGTDSTQCGSQTPTCSVTGTGIVGNTFKWYTVALNGTALTGQTASTLVSYPVAATTTFYVAEASADGLCESPRTAVTVTANTPYPFTLSATATTNCNGSASLTPVTIATNGDTTGTYTSYSWTNAATVTGNATTGWIFSPTATTTYTVTATDGLCSATANVVVTPTALPAITITPSPQAVCIGSPSTLTALTPVIGAGVGPIGAGALTSSGTGASLLPGFWGGAKSQYLIKASELTAQGFVAGNLTSLAFEPTTSGQSYQGFSLSLNSTTDSVLTSTFLANGTQVYAGTETDSGFTPVANAVNTLSFGTGTGSSTSFAWNGTSNLVVTFSWTRVPSASTSTASTMKYDAPGFNCAIYKQADGQAPAAMLAQTSGTVSSNRPKFTLGGQKTVQGVGSLVYTWNDPAASTGNILTVTPTETTSYNVYGYNGTTGCTGSATTTVTVYPFPLAPTATNASQCGTRVPTIAVADANGYTLPTIKWYADATTTTALQTSTSTTYTASVSATTTFYVSVVSPGGCESPRTEVTTTVIAPAVLTVSPAVTVCTGGSTTLTATGAVSYVWTPALGLNGTTSASVIATPGATTTYSVTGVDSNECTTAAAAVTVTVAAYPSALSITQGATSVCTNAVMSLTANGGTIGGAGNATIGTGTATTVSYNYPTAFANYWYQNWQQYLFTAAELNAAGITTAGSISSLQFNISALQDTSVAITDYNVKIGSTSSAALTAFSTNGLTNVYGPAAVSPAVGLNTITFSTPYVWDGVSNIVIDIRQSEAYGNGNATTYYTTTTNNSVLYAYSSSNNAGFWTSAPTPTTSTTRPNITFGYSTVNPTEVTWSPTTDLYTNAAATTAYSGANASVVYTKPTTEIVYTATAANGACTTTATTTVSPIALPVFTVSSDVTICSGTATTLEALGSGYTYVWTPALGLNGTTSASVIATPNVTTTYTVEATDLVTGCKATRLVTVTVINSGAILSIGTTTTQTVVASQSTTFTVATASGATYTYQWQLNDGSGWVNLSNAGNYAGVTTATLAVNNIEATFDGYQYQCLVTGAAPCTTLTPVVATLNISNTGFASQPLDVTMCNSGATTFSIATSGDEPFSIQWQMSTDNGLNYADIANGLNANGLTFAGTDQLTLNVSGITLANNGVKFTCIVNSYITSNSGTLTVKAPVVITTQPTDQAVCIGGGIATFTAVATGDELSYQWQYSTNGTTWSNYTGTDATTASISIVNPAPTAEGTQYQVVVSGNAVCSSVPSAIATLHINNPTITAAPTAVSVIRGNTAIFTVTASAATSYQWQSSATMNGTYADVVDATPIGNSYLGATTASLSVSTSGATVLGAGNYYRSIANNNGCYVTSTGALLTVSDYCVSTATSDDDEDISNVTLGSLNNSSVCGDIAPGTGSVAYRYSNYTNGNGAPQPADLTRSAVVPFSLTQTSCGGSYSNKFAIFIDWNQNGDFTDAGENVFQQATAAVGNNTQTGTITIPATASLGNTRMRVINIETTSAITACATYSWGETEDYLVNVMPTPPCDGTPAAGIASVASTSMCYGNGTNVVLNGSTTGVTGIAYQWYYSANGTSFAPIADATTTTLATGNLTADAYYYCTVTCTNSTLSANSNTIAITVANPLVTESTPGGRCATGTVVLGAAGNAGATINWYSALNGGSPIGTGTSFTTPSISATTTYYAQASAGGTAQVSNNGTPTFTTTTINTGLVLDITTASVLTSLDVYSTNAGTVTMQLVNSAGTVVAGPTSGAVIAGTIATPQTINLGWTLPVGTGFKILVTSQTGALGYSSGIFPSPLGNGVGTIVNGATSTGTTTLNYFLYNLRTTSACQSARTAVIATVDPTPTATISYAGAPFCNNAAVGSVTLNGTNAYTGGTYTSTSGLSLDGTSGDINPATSTPGTYVVTYTTNPTTYCTPQTATTTVVINESVLFSGFTYAAATYCNNSGIVTPTITGTPGAFTVSPATGLTVNATTGAIDFATAAPGTYTVTNTVTACNNNSVTDVTITVYSTVVVTTQPTSATVCAGANSSMTVAASGTNVVYQWQMSSNGTTWSNVTDGGAYSGATTGTLALTAVTATMTGTQFRALVSDANPCVGVTSSVATLTVSQPVAPVFSPAAPSVCIGGVNALSVSTTSFAQNGVIGTGSVTNTTSTPFKGYWGGSKSQYIYTAAELSALGYVNGTVITSLGLDITAYSSPYTFNGFNIAMKNSTATVSAAAFETGMTTVKAPTNYVLTGAAPFTATLPLDTNFTWDGTSNLVIQFCFNNNNGGGSSTNSANVKSTTNATALTTYYTSDNNGSVCSNASGTTSTTRPNMRFGVISGSLTWSPITDLYTNAAATTAYTGEMATTVYTKPTANITYTVTATNLLGCSNTASVDVTILAPSTLGSIVQPAVTCSGSPTTFNLTGLVANSTSTLSYTINGVAQTAVTGVVADASGNAMFTVSLPAVNNGKTLAITTITRTDLTPNCPTAITANNTLVIAVNPLVTYYADADGDGFGNNAVTQVGCGVAPAGFVLNNADCDDTNPAINAIVPYYVDADGDGFGSVITTSYCTATTPAGYSVNNLDCNDTVYSTTNICPSVVNLKFNIEGYYSAATQSMVPAKFNQSVVGATNTDVDDVTVELRTVANGTLVDTAIAALKTDGTAVATFATGAAGSFYVVVKYKNAVETWSALPQTIGLTPLTYNFTNAANKAFGANMVQVSPGVFAIYSGDINQDTNIDNLDYSVWEEDVNNFMSGYYPTDLNGDGNVDNLDYSIWETNSNNFIYSVNPFN